MLYAGTAGLSVGICVFLSPNIEFAVKRHYAFTACPAAEPTTGKSYPRLSNAAMFRCRTEI